jgi:hypothetical protein
MRWGQAAAAVACLALLAASPPAAAALPSRRPDSSTSWWRAAEGPWDGAAAGGDLDDLGSLLAWHTPRRLLVQDAGRVPPDYVVQPGQQLLQLQQLGQLGQQDKQQQQQQQQQDKQQNQQQQQSVISDPRLPVQMPAHVSRAVYS